MNVCLDCDAFFACCACALLKYISAGTKLRFENTLTLADTELHASDALIMTKK
jgi:hypothetical protein